jgi:6-phosphogluconolactonase
MRHDIDEYGGSVVHSTINGGRAAAAAGAGLLIGILAAPLMLTGAAAAAPTTRPDAPTRSAVPPGGRPLYVTNSMPGTPAGNVARFTIGATGTLTSGGSVPAGTGARGAVFTPDARFAYVAGTDAGEVSAYRVGAGGALTRIGAVPVPNPFGIAMAPNGRTVYVGGVLGRDIWVFRVGDDGGLTLAGTRDSGAINPKGVAVTPDGRFLYVSHGTPQDTRPSVLTGYAIGPDGSLGGEVANVPIGISGAETVITPDGRFVYVVCQVSDDAFGYRIGSGGALTPVPGQPFAAGDFPEGAAVTPDGRRMYVAALSALGTDPNGRLLGFGIGADGRLVEDVRPVTNLADPIGVGFAPSGRFMYVSDFSLNTVTAFSVAAGGALTPVQSLSSQGTAPAFHSVSVLPNLGPVASFQARAGAAGHPTGFDATASADRDGRVARYDWDFGDGTLLPDGGPTPRHVYRAPGTYQVRLTVTDDEGCSTRPRFTGQSATCAGTPAAMTVQAVTIPR